MLAVSLLTLGACSDSDDGGVGPSSVEVVQIVTVPNGQALTGLLPGDRRKILAVPTNSKGNFVDRTVTLVSSDPAVFTVSNDTIIAVAGGLAQLRATSGGQTDSVTVAVRFRVATVTLAPLTPVVAREGTRQITATLRDANTNPASGGVAGGVVVTGRPVTWTSSDTMVATVSATGLVSVKATPVDGSTTTITATATNVADGGVPASASTVLTVTGNAVVSSVTVTSGPGGAVGTGVNTIGFRGNVGTLQLTGTARSGLNNVITTPITWSSSAPSVATVDGAGLVTFVGGTGPVTITGTAVGAGTAGANVAGTAVFSVAPALINGVGQVASITANNGTDFAFSADRVGASAFTVAINGGSGDADLYVFAPGAAFVTNDNGGSGFVCRPYAVGNNESCTIAAPVAAGGWYRIRIFAYSLDGDVNGLNVLLTHP
jgi:hypothetical protein